LVNSRVRTAASAAVASESGKALVPRVELKVFLS
jgi:hypothetical protein